MNDLTEIKLEKGMVVCCTIYKGVSEVEASGIYKALVTERENNIPVPLTNTDLNMIITDVIMSSTPDYTSFETKYEVKMRGKLI